MSNLTAAAGQVFCHYMVGGMTADEAVQDIAQAQALGFDAFALNVMTLDPADTWSSAAIGFLFKAALAASFHLFFSFDTTHVKDPSAWVTLLTQYAKSAAYYKFDDKAFVSTFYGGNLQIDWDTQLKQPLETAGIPIYFVPSFNDKTGFNESASSTTISKRNVFSDLYSSYPAIDGMFNWDSSWPNEGATTNVSDAQDQGLMAAGKAVDKTYMMPLSSLQFKHLDTNDNWYRRGELVLAQRMPQILSVKPQFVEFQTWNDGGESHYMGNLWPEAMTGSIITNYTNGYNHSGWGEIVGPFIKAYKSGASDQSAIVPTNGAKVQGAFWYRSILKDAPCASDPLGKPAGWESAEDAVNVAVLLSADAGSATINIYSGGTKIGSRVGTTGLNAWSVSGLTTGAVKVEVVSGGSTLVSETGTTLVKDDADLANFNFMVVPLTVGGATTTGTTGTVSSAAAPSVAPSSAAPSTFSTISTAKAASTSTTASTPAS